MPGLSIVVPYVREELEANAIARAVIEQYFLPVIESRLKVTVRQGEHTLEISRETIENVAANLVWPAKGASTKSEIGALLRLARRQASMPPNEYVVLNVSGADGHYSLTKDSFPREILPTLSERFASNGQISLRIPVQVEPKRGPAHVEEVRLVLERDESLRVSNVPHLRSGINISKLRINGPAAVRGLLVVGFDPEQGPLDKLLQASEGPAHMNWEQRGEGYDKAKSLFEYAYHAVGFMRHLVRRVVEVLSSPQEDRDTRTLSTFFPDGDDDGTHSGGTGTSDRGTVTPDPTTEETVPQGVIEGIVRSAITSPMTPQPVEAANVRLERLNDPTFQTLTIATDTDGIFRFEACAPGNYQLTAQRDGLGSAERAANLPPEHGIRVQITLRAPPVPKMFMRVPLPDGFAIRGNPDFEGELRPIRVRLAYAAWGGSKSHNEADFSLNGNQLTISFGGVEEADLAQLVQSPNVLRFTPAMREFYLEVRGFDPNRGLHVDARAVEDRQNEGGEE